MKQVPWHREGFLKSITHNKLSTINKYFLKKVFCCQIYVGSAALNEDKWAFFIARSLEAFNMGTTNVSQHNLVTESSFQEKKTTKGLVFVASLGKGGVGKHQVGV